MGFGPPQGAAAIQDISAVNFSAGTTSSNVGSIVFSNSNGVSFGLNGLTITGTVATNYAGINSAATGCLMTVNTSGVSVNVGSAFVGLNTAQTNVTWTVNSSGISLNGGGYAGTNTAVTNCAVTLNTSGISVSVANPTISSYANMDQFGNTQTMTFNGASVSHAVAFQMPSPGSFSFLRIPVLMTTNTGSLAGAASITTAVGFVYSTWNAVVYSMSTGASSQSLVSVASGSAGFTLQNSISGGQAGNSTQYSITQKFSADALGSGITIASSTQYSQSAASATLSTGMFTNFSSLRWMDIRFANTLAPGPYWLVMGYSSSSTTSGQGASAMTVGGVSYSNHYGVTQANSWWEIMGGTAGSSGGYLGAGSFSTAGGGTTTAFPIGNISSSSANVLPYFQMIRSA